MLISPKKRIFWSERMVKFCRLRLILPPKFCHNPPVRLTPRESSFYPEELIRYGDLQNYLSLCASFLRLTRCFLSMCIWNSLLWDNIRNLPSPELAVRLPVARYVILLFPTNQSLGVFLTHTTLFSGCRQPSLISSFHP